MSQPATPYDAWTLFYQSVRSRIQFTPDQESLASKVEGFLENAGMEPFEKEDN